ncbi:MAG: hypothetical protein WC248_02650 [Candidatus Methanomethylophilaceae archaeon]|jgi:hypothetical protein
MADGKSIEKICDIKDCKKPAERSFSIKKVKETSLELKDDNCRQVHMCKDHYRVFKKETKNDIPDYMG